MGFTTDQAQTGVGATNTLPTSTDGILTSSGMTLAITLVDPIVVGDEGGWEITLTGAFPLTFEYYVEIFIDGDPLFEPQRCYSGIVGQADHCSPTNLATLKCWVPPLPINDGYDISVVSTDGLLSASALDMFEVIHRTFPTNLYDLRKQWPPPRRVGPATIGDED